MKKNLNLIIVAKLVKESKKMLRNDKIDTEKHLGNIIFIIENIDEIISEEEKCNQICLLFSNNLNYDDIIPKIKEILANRN